MESWGSPGMELCASTAMAWSLPRCGAGLCQGLRLSNEQDEWGLLSWWGWEEFGPQTGAMPCHLGLCPHFVYNCSHRKRRNCSQFLSKNMGNHWLSTTYLDPLYFIFLLHLPILHYHLFNLEESRDQFKIHWKSLWLSVVAPGSGPGGINC